MYIRCIYIHTYAWFSTDILKQKIQNEIKASRFLTNSLGNSNVNQSEILLDCLEFLHFSMNFSSTLSISTQLLLVLILHPNSWLISTHISKLNSNIISWKPLLTTILNPVQIKYLLCTFPQHPFIGFNSCYSHCLSSPQTVSC